MSEPAARIRQEYEKSMKEASKIDYHHCLSSEQTDGHKTVCDTDFEDTVNEAQSLDILLIGKTGNGKSATGNTILRREVFQNEDSDQSVTTQVQYEYTEFDGRKIKVVDTPGVEDTEGIKDLASATKKIIEKMEDAVLDHTDGYNAFLLVVKYGERYTAEDKNALKMLKALLGQNVVKDYCILIVTHGDIYRSNKKNKTKKFKQWCLEQKGLFKEMFEECEKRAILFDNNTDDEIIQERQMRKLISMIDKLQYGRKYTNSHFYEAKESRRSILLQSREPQISEKIRRKCSILMMQSESINSHEPEKQIPLLHNLIAEAKRLKQEVIEDDKGTGILKTSIDTANNILITLENQLNIFNIERENVRLKQLKEETVNKIEEMTKYVNKLKPISEEETNRKPFIDEIAEERRKLDDMEDIIKETESELKQVLAAYQRNLQNTHKMYKEMIAEMKVNYDELKEKNSTFGKRLKNLCVSQ